MREGCCTERWAGWSLVPSCDLGQATRAARAEMWAWHPWVLRHGSLRSWGCWESQPLSLSLLVPLQVSPAMNDMSFPLSRGCGDWVAGYKYSRVVTAWSQQWCLS